MGALKVSSQSSPNAVAGAIGMAVRQSGKAVIQVIGAGALNQAVKAIAIARGFLGAEGVDLVVAPSFAEVDIEGQPRTAIRLLAADRHATVSPDEASVRTDGDHTGDTPSRAGDAQPLATPPAR